VWWTNLRGKGTRNSPNGSLYGGGCPRRHEPVMEGRTGGRCDRRLGRGAARHCTRARGPPDWVRKRAERAGTGEVLNGRPGGSRELRGMEVKRGRLESGVRPL
jgi:hypothetical protein